MGISLLLNLEADETEGVIAVGAVDVGTGILVFNQNSALRTSSNTWTLQAVVDLFRGTSGEDTKSLVFPVTIHISTASSGSCL